ncbi:MAG: arylsulfatase, partial [Planctomycetota bacterium]|nr:arylsulfatase [Planctomycetota bacterium]
MHRACSLLSALLFAACASTPAAPRELVASRPNIVFVLSDDMGWNQPGFHGGDAALTPHLDRLAAQSTRLTQFYTHSVCAPTRGAFLTGRYAFRNWMDWRSEDFGKPSYLQALGLSLAHNERGEPTRRIHALDTEERTIAEALQEAGYFTALVGKWHCGEWLPEHLPRGQGFDHQYGHYAWGIDYFTKTIVHNAPARFAVYDWHRNGEALQEEGYVTDLIAAEAARVITSHDQSQPLFLYVPFNAVHGPLNPPPRYEGLEVRDAMLKCLDDGVGTIMDALDRAGMAQDTLLVFTNDNGPILEEMSAPYRGTKNTTFEGGVRVPCLVRWPGRTRPGATRDGMMFIADFFPTLISLAGGDHRQELPIDGLDQTAHLFGVAPSPRSEIVYEVAGSVRLPTLRSSDYKLMGDKLFDIACDPYETTDLAAERPEIVARLAARLAQLAAERPPLGDKPLLMD